MRSVAIHRRGQQDLDDIYDYIVRRSGSEDAALRFTGKLLLHVKRLASYLAVVGMARPDLGQSLRSVRHGDYFLVLRTEDRLLVLVRVVHSARRIERLRFEEPQRVLSGEVAA